MLLETPSSWLSRSSEHLHNNNHEFVVSQALQRCLPSASTLEVMLNSYVSLPPSDWVACLPAPVYQVSCPFGLLSWSKLQLLPRCFFSSSLRSTSLSSSCWASVLLSLALSSISVAALCVSTSEPDATQLSVYWTFLPPSGTTCCCGTMEHSTDVTEMLLASLLFLN